MRAILVNYKFTPTWLLTSGLDYMIYDRSEDKSFLAGFPQERIVYTTNVGQVDYDKLHYLVNYYEDLPDVFLWGKTNLFKYITEEEWQKVANNKGFTPLLTQSHKTYSDQHGVVSYYSGGIYHERNDGWYVNEFQWKHCKNYGEFAHIFTLPNPDYLPFAPGGNYLLTKEVVHKYSSDFYANMASILPYCQEPAEAQMAERSYYNLWT